MRDTLLFDLCEGWTTARAPEPKRVIFLGGPLLEPLTHRFSPQGSGATPGIQVLLSGWR